MQKLKILNTRERKDILNIIQKQWGAELGSELVFLYSEAKHKVYVVSRDIENVNLEELRIDSLGMYFGELMFSNDSKTEKELRLSIEASQIIGPLASKNVIEVSDKDAQVWIRGENIFNKVGASGWAIIKYKNDFIGSGRVKEKVVLNYLPKSRRIMSAEPQD